MKLGIGTVQFGMDYGISNQVGQSPISEVEKIIAYAEKENIHYLDTAHLYGNSESILGKIINKNSKHFSIGTKTPIFQSQEITNENVAKLELSFNNSLSKLKQDSIANLLVHHCNDLLVKNGERLYEKMVFLKNQGKVKKIGISAYSPDQISQVLEKYSIDAVQTTLNIFDQRLIQNNFLSELKKLNIEIQVRSIFLQGLLLMEPNCLPLKLESCKKFLKHYHDCLMKENISPLEASIGFVKQIPNIDYVIIGINSLEQLKQIQFIIKNNKKIPLDFSQFSSDYPLLIDPRLWNKS